MLETTGLDGVARATVGGPDLADGPGGLRPAATGSRAGTSRHSDEDTR